jgi:hypothetical protein
MHYVVDDITGGIRHVKGFCVTQEYSNGGSHETRMLSEVLNSRKSKDLHVPCEPCLISLPS